MSRHGDPGGLHLRKRGLQEDEMKRWMTALGTLAVTMMSARCAPVVLDPVQADPDRGSSGAAGPTNALAMLIKDVALAGVEDDAASSIDAENISDPDALVLMFGNQPESCTSPPIGIGGCTAPPGVWQGDLVLPSDLVQVGLVDLANPRVAAYQFTSPACAGGEEIASLAGTLEIVSIDAGSITVDLIDGFPVSIPTDGGGVPPVTLQGTFTIPRCP
jgi:hypothetical protein